VFYFVPLTYFYRLRNTVALKARSPKLIGIGAVLLCLDTSANAIIFSAGISNMRLICDLSIWCTVLFFFGVITVYYLRMHRVEQVYVCYSKYLKSQIADLKEDPSSPATSPQNNYS
jgi:hypothetical protein